MLPSLSRLSVSRMQKPTGVAIHKIAPSEKCPVCFEPLYACSGSAVRREAKRARCEKSSGGAEDTTTSWGDCPPDQWTMRKQEVDGFLCNVPVVSLDCGHQLCLPCASGIVKADRNNECPVCRTEIKVEDQTLISTTAAEYGLQAEIDSDEEVFSPAVVDPAVDDPAEYVPNITWSDKPQVIDALSSYGPHLQWATDELRGDKEVVLVAVRQDGAALQWASEGLRGDEQVVLVAVSQDVAALQWASEELRKDLEVVVKQEAMRRLNALSREGAV